MEMTYPVRALQYDYACARDGAGPCTAYCSSDNGRAVLRVRSTRLGRHRWPAKPSARSALSG